MRRLILLITILLLGATCLGSIAQKKSNDGTLSGLTIKCSDLSDEGVGSAYLTHTFSLLNADGNVSGYNWRFFLKDKQGSYVRISNGIDKEFTITSVSTPGDFLVNDDENLEGKIECDYTLNGESHSAVPFSISLELKPSIISIDDLTKVADGNYGFYLTFTVRYVGAKSVTVEIEEEYRSSLRSYRIDEPDLAHVKTGSMSNLYYSWVYIVATNQYGSIRKTLEFAPGEIASVPSISDDISNHGNVSKIALYSLDGRLIFTGTPSEFKKRNFNQGMYLKEEIYENGLSPKSKILFK
ncbi:MAG: hypothetical protein ACI30N_03945 [Muribaculaceae bacterium]